jgi:GNAT superfamily N-acetyltransferase
MSTAPELSDGLRLERRAPRVSELRALHRAVGWEALPDDDDAVRRGIEASLFCAVIMRDEEPVAGVRLVGDGAIYIYVQDLIVLPELQGRGLGDLLMEEVWRHLQEHAERSTFVGLMAAEGKAGFYERWGFAERPPGRPGMALGWDPDDAPRPGRPRRAPGPTLRVSRDRRPFPRPPPGRLVRSFCTRRVLPQPERSRHVPHRRPDGDALEQPGDVGVAEPGASV